MSENQVHGEDEEKIPMQGFRYALYKTSKESLLRRFAGCRRFIYNKGLDAQLKARERGEKMPRYVALANMLPAWKVEHPWLKEAHSQILQQALKDLDRAWSRRFKDLAKLKRKEIRLDDIAGEPTFRHRGECDTFRYPQPKPEHIDAANGRVFLPKIGWLRYRNSRPAVGEIRQISVTQDAGHWMVSLTMKRGDALLPCDGEIIAADRGVRDTLALSDGTSVAPLDAYKKSFFRLRRYQRAVSRKIEAQKKAMGLDPKAPFPKGVHPKKSNRQRHAEARVSKCHRKIANQRRDWLHKETTKIADRAGVVVLEDLRIKNMTGSAKGTADVPGKRVAQKAGLNKSILDQGWYMLEQMLAYKLEWRGGELIKVPAPYTSQKCSAPGCGHIDAASRKDKKFVCTRCGHIDDADQNAAKNILAAGLAVLASRTAVQMDAEDAALSGRPIRAKARAKRQPPQSAAGAASCG